MNWNRPSNYGVTVEYQRGAFVEIEFTKLHGNGNDFILIDEYEGVVIPDPMKGEFAASFCDRHFGIGADGVLYLSKSAAGGTCGCACSSLTRARQRCAGTGSGVSQNMRMITP